MNIAVKWRSSLQRLLTFPYLLAIIALFYVGAYLALPFSPGNSVALNTPSWWAWFDQSQYLKAANALHVLDFSADQYFYPPLYPAFGSLFLGVTSTHPFFLVNLSCLLWFAYVFIRFSDLYVPRLAGVILLFFSTILPILIFENFVIPWTTSLSTAFLSTGILGLIWVEEIKQAKLSKLHYWQVLLVTTALGLMVPTRPVDAIVGMLIGCAFVLSYLRLQGVSAERWLRTSHFLALAIIGALVGPVIFIGFNLLVHGAPLGNYLQVASSHGFFIADLPEKFYSIWIDAQPLYGELGAGLIEHYPWLLLSLAGLVLVILQGDFLLRTLAVAIIVFFILYLPYGDLLPNGLWRFLNIHYFKWTFAFFALFAGILLGQLVKSIQLLSAWKLPFVLLIGVPLFILLLQMRIQTGPLSVEHKRNEALNVTLPNQYIDFVDIKGLSGDFSSSFFGEHTLSIDGQALKLYRHFRLLERGTFIRILFIRPVQGRELKLRPDSRLQSYDEQLNAQWGVYHFTLGLPTSVNELQVQEVSAAYRLGQTLDFSNQGISHFYIQEGFSIPENDGRWSLNDNARINLRIADFSPDKKVQLALTYRVLVAGIKECQQVILRVNQQKVGDTHLCLQNLGNIPKTYYYDIRPGIVGKEGLMHITIETPDSVSARQLKINTDDRKLGVYVKALVVTQ